MGTPNPGYSVQFYIRPPQKDRLNKPTQLRLKAWISATKSYLFLSTDIKVTPLQFDSFNSYGIPSKNADPDITKVIDRYRAAANLVLSGAIVNGKIMSLTSEEFKSRVEGVIVRMNANEQSGVFQPITPFATPESVKTCKGCVFCGRECSAPWLFDAEAERAAELADFNRICRERVIVIDDNKPLWQPNPNVTPQPIESVNLLASAEDIIAKRKEATNEQ